MSGHMPWFVAPDRKDLVFVPGVLQPMRCGSAERARLVAAAPKLLKALQSIVDSLAEHDDEGMIEHAEQMIAARAAIAEATGETP